MSIVFQLSKKTDFKDVRRAFKIWRLNSGMAQKQYENQEKTLILAKYANKFHLKSLNHVKIQYYQKWKRLALNSQDGHASSQDRIVSQFSQIITSTEDFNRCVESDFYISQILNEKLSTMLGGLAASDILFHHETIGDEANPPQAQLKGYNDMTGEQIDYSVASIAGMSLIGRVIQAQNQGSAQRVTVYEAITSQPQFNKEVDLPLN